jgi:hypothetical protein
MIFWVRVGCEPTKDTLDQERLGPVGSPIADAKPNSVLTQFDQAGKEWVKTKVITAAPPEFEGG